MAESPPPNKRAASSEARNKVPAVLGLTHESPCLQSAAENHSYLKETL